MNDTVLHHLSIAHHLLRKTYPSTHDPKILLVAAEHIYLAADHFLSAAYPHHSSFSQRIRHLSKSSPSLASHLRDLHEAMHNHEESTVEFGRNGAYIICDDNYRTTMLSLPLLIHLYDDISSLAGSTA